MSELRQAAQAALEYIEAPTAKLWPAGTLHHITINLRAAIAQPPAPTAQPAQTRWALCPETGEPCRTCQTSRIPCEAAQPVQQPTASAARKLVNEFARACAFGNDETRVRAGDALLAALSAAPAERQPLSDEQIEQIGGRSECWDGFGLGARFLRVPFARAIEAAHGIATAKGEKL